MNAGVWLFASFLLEFQYFSILNAAPLKDGVILLPSDKLPPPGKDRQSLLQRIEDMIRRHGDDEDIKGLKIEGPFNREDENLPDQVTITKGYCTLWEYFKSWVIPGYQPETHGTAANPLVQHTFRRINGVVPAYGVKTIAPSSGEYVTESSRYLAPTHANKLVKSAKKIMEDIQNSPEKFRFA